MTTADAQVRIMMKERRNGRTQEQAAAKANIGNRKTVAKYEKLGQLPSRMKKVRSHRTRANPFEADWLEVERMLSETPELEAKALFEWLQEQRPGKYTDGQVRTFQRHVADWRALNQAQVAILEQVHQPGEAMQTDGTWLTELGVMIQGEPFNHLLIHSVLPYSNWEWGRVAQSESLSALRLGLQSTLVKLGHVPKYHQTDNPQDGCSRSTAATYRLGVEEQAEDGSRRGYTTGYLQMLEHYGMEPRTIHIGAPNENGDIESSNGGLKRSVKQHLLLRGSRDFDSIEEYEAFLGKVIDKRNRSRQERLAEELAVMKALTSTPLSMCTEYWVRVSQSSLIPVLKNHYSVPTSLIGKRVRVRVYEWHLEVYYRLKLVETLPRLVGKHKYHVNYRYVIDSVLRKPGGFRNYRYQDALFPTLVFRRAWEQLNTWQSPRKADLSYLRVLRLAAHGIEADVMCALELLVATGQPWNETDVERLVKPDLPPAPEVSCGSVSLEAYDQLLQEVSYAIA